MEKTKRLDIPENVVKRARLLDEDALATLVKESYPFIFRYLYYRTNLKEDAEDLTNDVFVRMVSAIEKQKGNFIAWLFRIAKNVLIDYYRKKGGKKETSLNEVQEITAAKDKNNRDSLYPEDIKKMLQFLTDDQKEVITLKFIEGHSNEEIARSINKSVGAVKLLQFRALTTLRDVLKREMK